LKIVKTRKKQNIGMPLKEEVELDEAMTTAIALTPSTDKNYKTAVGIIQKYRSQGVKAEPEKKGNSYEIVVDGPVSAMRKLEKEMKQSGIKFMATESVELDEGVLDNIKKIIRKATLIPQAINLASAVEKSDIGAVNANINTILDKMKLSGKERETKRNELYKTLAKTTKNRNMAVILDKMASVNEDVELDEAKPPFDVDKKINYAKAAKNLRAYAMKKGGVDKDDMLRIASELDALSKRATPQLLARTMKNIQDLDTDVREVIMGMMKESNCVMEMTTAGYLRSLMDTKVPVSESTKTSVGMSIMEKAIAKLREAEGEKMTDAEMKKRDEIMKELEKKKDDFEKRYGDRAKEVMARTAIKMAKGD
jgi:hypothetical protein